MSLKSQIEKLQPGESFVTKASRTGIYVAAKRADVEISTEIAETGTKVTRKSEAKRELSLVDQIAALSPKDRLALFEHFELCCGMNRGECVCLGMPMVSPEQVAYSASQSASDDRQAKLSALSELAKLSALSELMANPQSDVILPPPIEEQTHWEVREGHSPNSEPVVFDAWHGWSDELQTPDRETGEIVTYREHLKTRKRKEIRRESSLESA